MQHYWPEQSRELFSSIAFETVHLFASENSSVKLDRHDRRKEDILHHHCPSLSHNGTVYVALLLWTNGEMIGGLYLLLVLTFLHIKTTLCINPLLHVTAKTPQLTVSPSSARVFVRSASTDEDEYVYGLFGVVWRHFIQSKSSQIPQQRIRDPPKIQCGTVGDVLPLCRSGWAAKTLEIAVVFLLTNDLG